MIESILITIKIMILLAVIALTIVASGVIALAVIALTIVASAVTIPFYIVDKVIKALINNTENHRV